MTVPAVPLSPTLTTYDTHVHYEYTVTLATLENKAKALSSFFNPK